MSMVKKGVFDWKRTGQKSVELRRDRARQGDNAVFHRGQDILRGIILKKEKGVLLTLRLMRALVKNG